MKKTLSIALLLMVGAAFAASTITQTKIEAYQETQSLEIHCWCGTATDVWDSFQIFLHIDEGSETGHMWGTWYRDGEGGWIEGRGWPDPAGPSADWYLGEGTFSGDDNGVWNGHFVLSDTCWGYLSRPPDPCVSEFFGHACE